MSVSREPALPLLSANKLALYSGLDRRTVEKRLLAVTPKRETKRERLYRLQDALPALIQSPAAAESEARILALREREQQAKTEAAEVAQLEREKKTCRISTAKLYWSEGRIRVRQIIERTEFLTPLQRNKLLARIAALPPTPPPEPEPVD